MLKVATIIFRESKYLVIVHYRPTTTINAAFADTGNYSLVLLIVGVFFTSAVAQDNWLADFSNVWIEVAEIGKCYKPEKNPDEKPDK